MLKGQLHQMSSEPKNVKTFWLKKHVNLRNCYFDCSMWMLLFGKECVCVREMKIILFQISITLLWSAILQIRMTLRKSQEDPFRYISTTQVCQLMFHQFNNSQFTVTGFSFGQFAISIPNKGVQPVRRPYSRLGLLKSYCTLQSVSPGVCSAGRGTILLSVSAIWCSVSAAGKGLMCVINVNLHTQHLLHQGRDRKANPSFQMPSLMFSQNYFLNIQTFRRLLAAIYAFYIQLLGMALLPIGGLDFSNYRKPICSVIFQKYGVWVFCICWCLLHSSIITFLQQMYKFTQILPEPSCSETLFFLTVTLVCLITISRPAEYIRNLKLII